jgi:cell division protein FtsB
MVRTRLNLWNSLFGWSSILLAGMVYAVLTLAPRIVVWEELSREQAAGRAQLEQLHAQTRQMEEMVATIEREPRILEELARAEWRVESESEETIVVDSSLRTNFSDVSQHPHVNVAKPAAYIDWLKAVSVDESLRGKLMLAAIALCLIPILSAPRDRRPAVTR